MAEILRRVAPGLARAQRQHRLAALQGLDLALLIDAENQSVLRRAHVKAHHVPDLLHVVGVGG